MVNTNEEEEEKLKRFVLFISFYVNLLIQCVLGLQFQIWGGEGEIKKTEKMAQSGKTTQD